MSDNPFASLDGPIYGSLYFATLITTALYGVTCMQTFYYYVHYQNDSRPMKCLVTALWALDTIHEALTISGVYKYVMAGLANPSAMMDEIPELVQLQILSEGFFVYRIYLFSGKNIVAPILWIIQAIYQIVAGIIYVAKSFYSADGSLHVFGYDVIEDSFHQSIATSCLCLNVTVDVLIAIVMTYLLVRKRTANGFASTTQNLQRLTMFAVNTGIWTATFAVLSLILLRRYPSNLLQVVFGIPLSSLYCNTLLANLNARTYIRGEAVTHNVGSDLVTVSSPVSGDTNADKQSEETKFVSPAHQGIWKTREVVTFRDFNRSTEAENSV
ncbi:hypothetical protein HD554DRAFT_2174528 [Boletus coccyginus]|nr:hypothetical protein HD554DRAFT_2174528 [Boletus coccyginus]